MGKSLDPTMEHLTVVLKGFELNTLSLKITCSRGVCAPFENLPPKSIALDGYVQGPRIDVEAQRYSFDHHDGCLRLVTKATCEQVLDAILLGFDPKDHVIYVNDVDGDTVLATWLLCHAEEVHEYWELHDLVRAVGNRDAHGPAYPVSNPELVEAFYDKVMLPEKLARIERCYDTCDLAELMKDCLHRLDDFLDGGTKLSFLEREPEDCEITHQGEGWVMARSDSHSGFQRLYSEGVTRAILYTSPSADGSIRYTVGKKSDLVGGFPVGPVSKQGTILQVLHQREPGWGGGSSIGGSPRNPDGSSSYLSPDQVFEIVQEVLRGKG